MVQRVTANDNEWKQMTRQRVTTNDDEWQRVVQRVKKSDNEWYSEWQLVTKNWKWVTASDSSGTTNENGTVHFKGWMIAILSITKTDTLLLQGINGCN